MRPKKSSCCSPFFEAHVSTVPSAKRYLLISYHFPPGEVVGALRWQKLLQFAAERGWTFDVVSLHPSNLDKLDNTRLAELPAGTRIYGIPIPKLLLDRIEGFAWRFCKCLRRKQDVATNGAGERLAHLTDANADTPETFRERYSRYLKHLADAARRAYFAWMEYYTHGGWVDEVTKLGRHLVATERYEAIITSGPPHMTHEAGRRLAKLSGLPLVVDFRDAWSLAQRLADYFDSPLWYKMAEYYEPRVIAQASLVVMNTARARAAMQKAYSSKQAQIIAVMNGFDEEPSRATPVKDKFIIAYAGAIYLDRDPTQLLEVMARVVRTLNLSPGEIGLELMGHVESYRGASLQQLAEEAGIADYVKVIGPSPRNVALAFLARASVLVSLPLFRGRGTEHRSGRPLQQNSDMAIPAKIFEYMQFDAWILAIAQQGSAAELLLRDSEADVVEPGDLQGMADVLIARYQQFRGGVRPVRLSVSMSFASRRAQATLLFDAIAGLHPMTKQPHVA